MKRRLAILLTALPALAMVNPSFGQVSVSGGVQINVPSVQITPPSVQINAPGVGISVGAVGDFYQPLSPYGTWVDFQSYGRCWHPTQVAADWQPYTDGSWEYTDAGWYFNSDEPWGWATCHYGSWANDPSVGWVWIPGIQWAPAWVTWRTSDDYIGWAPCGPRMSVLAPSLFVFVGVHDFGGRFTPGANVFIRNNTTIINRTRVINDFSRRTVNVDGRQKAIFANTGPNVKNIQRATGRQFTPRPVNDVVRESKSRAPENLRNQNRPGENRPEQQRYNNQPQRPNENYNRETTPPPTGREQQRNYNSEEQNRLNQEQQRNNIENQNRINQQQRQQQQREQRSTPQATPSEKNLPPTGREVTPPSQRQQEIRPSQPPTERPVPSERTAPTERPTPSERATPPQKNMTPTGRENAPSSQRQQEARPSQAPQQHAPAQAPEQQKKDNKDQ